MAPQHSSARLSSTSDIAGPPPPPLVVPASLRPSSYPGGRGHTSGLRLPQHRPGRGGPLAPFLGRERSAPACRGREGCLGPSGSPAAAHAPAQRTRASSEPGARVHARPARPSPAGPPGVRFPPGAGRSERPAVPLLAARSARSAGAAS